MGKKMQFFLYILFNTKINSLVLYNKTTKISLNLKNLNNFICPVTFNFGANYCNHNIILN